MKTKKRIISIIMSLLIIASNILQVAMIQATDNIVSAETDKEISSEVNLLTETNVNAISETNSEPSKTTDNWQLDVVFYDSTVDNGTTPLSAINWDASDGGYETGEPRVITVQISYKNTNAIKTYQAGDLTISIPNLAYKILNEQVGSSIIVGANDSTHEGYDWNFTTADKPSAEYENFTFTNKTTFEELSNFEGTIQISYTLEPLSESIYGNASHDVDDEKYDDECTHEYFSEIQATLNSDVAISNKITFNYTRTYIHKWNYSDCYLTKTAEKLSSYDGICCENAENYIWVKYKFDFSDVKEVYDFLRIRAKDYYIKDEFTPNCVVIYKDAILEGKEVTEAGNIVYETDFLSTMTSVGYGVEQKIGGVSFYVGYPVSEYNEENNSLNIKNYAELWGTYENKSVSEKLADSTVSLNLNEFIFNYDGELYGITKNSQNYKNLYSNFLLDPDFIHDGSSTKNQASTISCWELNATAVYTGTPMTVQVGDDLLGITDANNEFRKLNDDEYFYEEMYLPYLKNLNGDTIGYDKYPTTLYVKYEGKSEYVKYLDLSGYKAGKQIKFSTNDKVVAHYIQIENIRESLVYNRYIKSDIAIHIKPTGNIAETGTIYNFGYIKVYFKDENGNLVLQNEPTIDSYSNFITKEEIASFDMNTYGSYIQRATASMTYDVFKPFDLLYTNKVSKFMWPFSQDAANQQFSGRAAIRSFIKYKTTNQMNGIVENGNYSNKYTYIQKVYLDYLDQDTIRPSKLVLYDLLPLGMELTSSKEEILNSLSLASDQSSNPEKNFYTFFFDLDGNKAFSNNDELIDYIKQYTSVEITENWNNTKRTKIEITVDYGDNALFHISEYGIKFDYNYNVSYDSYLLYGSKYTNYVYGEGWNNDDSRIYSSDVKDNGTYDASAKDINENGNTNEYISYAYSSSTITSVVSTHQDIQVQVKTDLSNYSTGSVKTTPEAEYSYKLRARTGENSVTNLVLINNIEEAYGSKENYWKGEFLGIDTSFAENRVYNVYDPSNEKADASGYVNEKLIVKVYYSTNKNEGNLYKTELQTVTDNKGNIVYNEDGTELKMEVRITDSNGNFVRNTNWLEYDDAIDKSKVKSLAFEFLNAETGKAAILPANNLVYVEVLMKAPIESEGISDQGVKYAYNNCFTQWNAIDEFNQTVDFITGINSNIVSVSFPVTEETITISKIWQLNQDYIKINIKDSLGFAADFDYIEILDATETTVLETITNSKENGLIVSINKYDIDKSYFVKVYMKDGTIYTTIINKQKFNIVPVSCELLINGLSQETFELNNENNWTHTLTVLPGTNYEIIEKTTGTWTYEVTSTDNGYVVTNTVDHEIEIVDIIVPPPEEIVDTGNESTPSFVYIIFLIGLVGLGLTLIIPKNKR